MRQSDRHKIITLKFCDIS